MTVISFNFADRSALSNSDFLVLTDHSIPYQPISYTDSQKGDIRKAFDEIRTVANITFMEVEEIGSKVRTNIDGDINGWNYYLGQIIAVQRHLMKFSWVSLNPMRTKDFFLK